VARAIWSGSISFGLVSVPVRMFGAVDEHDLHFHLLHTKDDSRIGYEKVCKEEGKPVPDDEIAKAFEVAKGEFVYVTDEDFEAAQGPSYRTIDLTDFVPWEQIDPIYLERTFYLAPGEGGEKVYALLVEALKTSGLVGVGKVVMRDKQQLGCVRVRDGVLTFARMYFADEIRPVDDVKPARARVGKRELELAASLIERYAGDFDIGAYRDDYRDALAAVIEAKRKGERVQVEEPAGADTSGDLLDALRASLEAHRPARRNGSHSRNGETREDLRRRAKAKGVRGYSKMTKRELVAALDSR
jgi:DNA end-binding protein Ku